MWILHGNAVLGMAMLQMLYARCNLHSYSIINFGWFLVSLVWKEIGPYVFVNSVVATVSFYCILLFEPNTFITFMERNSVMFNHLKSLLFHIIPLIISSVRVKDPIPLHVGFYTMLHHLCWGFSKHSRLILSDVYIPIHDHTWYLVWTISCMIHLLSPWML